MGGIGCHWLCQCIRWSRPIKCSGWQTLNKGELRKLLSRRVEQIPACTRPLPIDSSLYEPTPNWILMDVIDGGLESRRVIEISVVTCSFLPIPKASLTWTLLDCQSIEERGVNFDQAFLHPL